MGDETLTKKKREKDAGDSGADSIFCFLFFPEVKKLWLFVQDESGKNKLTVY